MEIKKGDKLILEPVEVFDIISEDEIYIRLKGGEDPIGVTKQELTHARKVLGLLGDEGLEAQVGMKVWDSMFGDGRIIEVNELTFNPYSVLIKFESDKGTFSRTGRWKPHLNRTCYVTAMPEEEKGWAVWKLVDDNYGFAAGLTTKRDAENKFGYKLLSWIPESEVKK